LTLKPGERHCGVLRNGDQVVAGEDSLIEIPECILKKYLRQMSLGLPEQEFVPVKDQRDLVKIKLKDMDGVPYLISAVVG